MKKPSVAALAAFCLVGCALPATDPAPAGTEKEIMSFFFSSPPATGVVDQGAKTITVGVPAGTGVSSLAASFTTTGARVTVGGTEQISGQTQNDFTSPVTYVVTAEDGTTSAYVVTVTVAPPPSAEKAITSFSFLHPAAAGKIDQDTKTVTIPVPHGTDVSSLIAVYSATGTRVTVDDTEQASGVTINDFTDPLTYVVTAEDGSEARYTVTVAPAPGSEKAIISFSILIPPAEGTIDPAAKMIRVRLPEGTALSGLVATFATTGAEVKVNGTVQVSGVTVNDFNGTVSYVVTAEDGSTATWSVRVVGTIGLLINELDIDQVGADTAEYIELYACADVDPVGIVIVLLNGGVTPGQEYARIDLSSVGSIDGGSYCVVAGSGVAVPMQSKKYTPTGWESSNRIQNGPADAVMLFDTIGRRVIDTVSYNGVLHRAVIAGETGEFDATEGAAGAPADSNAVTGSIGRYPNGVDSGQNGADFKLCPTITPGAPNM